MNCKRWTMLLTFYFLLMSMNFPIASNFSLEQASNISNWAASFGNHLYHLLSEVTYLEAIQTKLSSMKNKTNYAATYIKERNGEVLLAYLKLDLETMLQNSIASVERIAEQAQNRKVNSNKLQENVELNDVEFKYLNAREIQPILTPKDGLADNKSEKEVYPEHYTKLPMQKMKHFGDIPITLNETTVHVPVNVYDRAKNVMKAIKWSAGLDDTFKTNYEYDKALTWQYFCSSAGFLRQYPGTRWARKDPDLYDCRVRNWYIQAAASPKDVVILLDLSGSMAGLRKEIAKHVVHSLLDTLTENDFVAVMTFSDETNPLIPCFGEDLVQANMENLRAFKTHLEDLGTFKIANFNDSLIKAFNMLERAPSAGRSSNCNQAIMVVTDGAPYTYESIFRQYNWNKDDNTLNTAVRVFTYLIGREVTARREVKWMACVNYGYFSHVTTLSEVREQTLKYIPVMARPLVQNNANLTTWTNVYADVTYPKLTDYLWSSRIKMRTRKMMEQYLDNYGDGYAGGGSVDPKSESSSEEMMNFSPIPDDYYISLDHTNHPPEDKRDVKSGFSTMSGLKMMTTVSKPVLDKENQDTEANLLGVAGIDIPIDDIKKLLTPYKLGFNGYSFAISNNGHVLFHPDFRPLFDDILKPNYNSVDLAEVELVDSDTDSGPREFHEDLEKLRRFMIDRKESAKVGHIKLPVLTHTDNMRRVRNDTMLYYFTPLTNTPFTLGIALSERYGRHEMVGRIDFKQRASSLTGLRGNWTIHPEWVYCQYNNFSGPYTSKELLKSILQDSEMDLSYLKKSRNKESSSPHIGKQSNGKYESVNCDFELIESMLFDASVSDTSNLEDATGNQDLDHGKQQAISKYGITSAYIGTRSGLTKYKFFYHEYENETIPDVIPNRTVDENYYKLAVDFYEKNPKAFVFSLPINSFRKEDSGHIRVTGSQAIFEDKSPANSPWGVVGVNMRFDSLRSGFLDGLTDCVNCNLNCSGNSTCYLLDSNAMVVVSSTGIGIGRFFGEIDVNLLNATIQYDIFRVVKLYDYQGVCLDVISSSGGANFITSPFRYLASLSRLIWSTIATFLFEFSLFDWVKEAYAVEPRFDHYITVPNKTQPRPCDKEIKLLQYQGFSGKPYVIGKTMPCSSSNCVRKFVMSPVQYTNLILFVVDVKCDCESVSMNHDPIEVQTNGTDPICLHNMQNVYRRPPTWECKVTSKHEKVKECGRGTSNFISPILLLLSSVVCLFNLKLSLDAQPN